MERKHDISPPNTRYPRLPVALATWVALSIFAAELRSEEADTDDARVPITFSRLVLREHGKFDIGIADAEFRVTIIEELRRRGYNAVGVENILFDQDKSNQAVMLLGGVINELSCPHRSGARTARCDIAVNWEIFDKRENQVVYKVLTRYRKIISLQEKDVADESHKLILGSINRLVQRPKFNEMIEREITVPSVIYEAASYRRCDLPELALPDQMERILDASIIVKAGERIGSGFFISPDGLALTADHLLSGQDTVKIVLRNGFSMTAKVLRRDSAHDLALISVAVEDAECLPLSPDLPSIGTNVYAIGAPAGADLAFSVSSGIVSGIREIEGDQLVQTDASINPGNSGGPIVNNRGEVVAIVSWKVTLPGFEGLGFGIPSTIVEKHLAIEPSSSTSEIPSIATGGDSFMTFPIVDTDDPHPASRKAATAATAKSTRTGEPRFFYSSGRVTWFVLGLGMVGGGIGAILSTYAEYDNMKNTDSSQAAIDEEFRTLKILNTVGWAVAIVGAGNLFLFSRTGKRQEAQKPAQVGSLELTLGVSPNGAVLGGRF